MEGTTSTAARRAAWLRGSEAEARVATVLEAAGWTVRARNWRGGGGELDLVVSRGESIRFVEVKRRAGAEELGLESIDSQKQSRLVRAARAWLARECEEARDMAFTVAIVKDQGIHWLDAAFDA